MLLMGADSGPAWTTRPSGLRQAADGNSTLTTRRQIGLDVKRYIIDARPAPAQVEHIPHKIQAVQ
jgi:hypothetical protein